MKPKPSLQHGQAFTLVELLLSTAIIALIMLVLVSITGQTSATWRYTTAKIEQFREARTAFDTMSTRISQATLNTYWDYFDSTGQRRTPSNMTTFVAAKYGRQSELLFTSGQASKLLGNFAGSANATRVTHAVFFHAPLGVSDDNTNQSNITLRGLNNLLNVWGYYVEYRDDQDLRPPFITNSATLLPRYRYRLMELMMPTNELGTYVPEWTAQNSALNGSNAGNTAQYNWFRGGIVSQTNPAPTGRFYGVNTNPQTNAPVHVLAENIIALIIRPQLSKQDADLQTKSGKSAELTTDYYYDTRYDPASPKGKYSDPVLDPINQLPPILQVTMVAIDEASASRINLGQNSATNDIFGFNTPTAKFTTPTKYETDLLQTSNGTANPNSLESTLISKGVGYRIFTTDIPIRGAKWSREQTN